MALIAYAYSSVGQLLGDGGPIRLVTGGSVILGELNQFNTHSLTFALGELDDSGISDAERLIDALAPWTLIQLVQTPFTPSIPGDDGTLAWGYVLNPRQQISDRDEHTITLDLHPLTDELTDHRVHRGWQAQNRLSVIASRIGSFRQGWTGRFTDAGTASDITVLVTSPDTTPLDLFLSTATQFSQYARQGVDGYGVPNRTLEMGQFGAAPTVTLTSGNGGDAEAMAANGTVRVPASIDRSPADVTNLMTVCTPFGGGTSTDSVVTLERLWRIINDPTYPNYGKYGNVPGSIFPEYDPNYPISDPENAPTGNRLYLTPAGTLISPGVFTDAQIVAGGGVLLQGAVGTRYPTLDGHWDYMVYDNLAYIGPNGKGGYGHRDREFIQPQISYTDTSVANQELSARALYLSAIANFKRFAHPHHTFACTVANANGRVTRAGDQIAVDYQRATSGAVEMAVTENLIVMRTTRHFEGENPAYDELLLSNLGRFDRDDPAGSASAAKAIIALQINRGTGLAKDSVTYAGNIDSANPITLWHYISAEHFRYHQVRVRVDFFSFRGTANTAYSDPNIPLNIVNVSVPHDVAHTLTGAGVTEAGIGGTTDGFDLVQTGTDNAAAVQFTIENFGTVNPDGQRVNVESRGGAYHFTSSAVPNGTRAVANLTINFTKAKTKSAFTAAVNKAISVAQTLTAQLPSHNHEIEKRIPTGQPAPSLVTMSINSLSLSRGAKTTGTRDANTGGFTTSFIVSDIGADLDAYTAGTDVPITFNSFAGQGNPFGVGWLQITITSVEELGGNAATVIAD